MSHLFKAVLWSLSLSSLGFAAGPAGFQTDGPGTAFPSFAGGVTRVPPVMDPAPVLLVPQLPPEAQQPARRMEVAPPVRASPRPAAPEVVMVDEWVPMPGLPQAEEAPPPSSVVQVNEVAPPVAVPDDREPVAAPQLPRAAHEPAVTLLSRARTKPPQSRPTTSDFEVLDQAREAIAAHRCLQWQPRLRELAGQQPRNLKTEAARVLSARCLVFELHTAEGAQTYQRYLEEYPAGRFVDEARAALAE